MRIIVGITGASGAIYGVRLVQALVEHGVETHLVLSPWAEKNIELETRYSVPEVRSFAHRVYEVDDLSAPVASGSCPVHGMVVAPCTMKSVAAIAHGYADNLIHRCADVALKEGRTLILVPRETPLHQIHLENLFRLACAGVVIMPPIPAFYFKPQTIEELVEHHVGRVLHRLGIENDLVRVWDNRGDK